MDRMIALKPEWFQTHLAFALWEAWGGWNAAGRTGDPHPAWPWALEEAEPETRAQTKTILADMGTVNDYGCLTELGIAARDHRVGIGGWKSEADD